MGSGRDLHIRGIHAAPAMETVLGLHVAPATEALSWGATSPVRPVSLGKARRVSGHLGVWKDICCPRRPGLGPEQGTVPQDPAGWAGSPGRPSSQRAAPTPWASLPQAVALWSVSSHRKSHSPTREHGCDPVKEANAQAPSKHTGHRSLRAHGSAWPCTWAQESARHTF